MDTATHTRTQAAPCVDTPSTPALGARVSDTRRMARAVLNGHSGRYSHRLTLVLALVVILTVAIALYVAVGCLFMVGSILFPEALWISAVSDALLILLCLVLVLPLLASLWRLACLMTAPDGRVMDGLPVSVPAATLIELFYPFTSFRAYGRTMAVAMEWLAFTLLSVGAPILCFCLTLRCLVPLIHASSFLFALLSVAVFLLFLSLGLLAFFLSGRRAGFGFFVFIHEDMTLSDVNRYYKGFRRPLIPAFCLRMSLVGWYALSAVGILVPFILHACPYGLCCAAVYGRTLQRF